MHIDPVEDLDALQRYHAVESAAQDHDFVALPADPLEELIPHLDGVPKAGELTQLYVATRDDVPVGTLAVHLPLLDNVNSAQADICVHPDQRRGGVGRALLDFALQEVRRRERNRVFFQTPWAADGSEGPAFPLLRSAGARPVLDNYRRILDLGRHPVGERQDVPAGYRVVQWVDVAPEDVVDGCAYLIGRMTLDAPMGDMDIEQEKWDATRYRQKEADAMARHRRRIASAVVHDATGQVAGVSDIGVNRERTDIAYQWDTIVDPDHRGHGLGMVLKTWNHAYLLEQVSGITHINTWNAASNTFMVAVNDALGFEAAEKWTEWQLDF